MSNLTPAPGDRAISLDRAMRWLCAGRQDLRWIRWVFVAAAILYLSFLAIAGTGPITKYGHDVYLLLDGGWRIFNGQVPYRDFYLAFGPLEYLLVAIGMLLTNGDPGAIAIGNALFGVIIGIWGWQIAVRRMPIVAALLITGWLILTATAPSPIGSPPTALSCAMIYNRHGYALIGIVLVECAFAANCSRFWGGVSSGVALGLLAFLKLNFFGAAGLMLLASLPVKRDETPRVWGALAGFSIAAASFLVFLRFSIHPFLRDMSLAIHARGSGLAIVPILFMTVWNVRVVILIIVTIAVAFLTARNGSARTHAIRILLLCGVTAVTGTLMSLTNTGEYGMPYRMASLWGVVLLGYLAAAYPTAKNKIAIAAVFAMSLGLAFHDFSGDVRSVKALVEFNSRSVRAMGATTIGRGMGRLRFYELNDPQAPIISRNDNGQVLVDCVNDGLQLLESSSSPEEKVLPLGFYNPFAYILRRKPAIGGSPWLTIGVNFPATQTLDGSEIFGNADLIMVPHFLSTDTASDIELQKTYHAYLSYHFSFVSSSQRWSLYRRNR